METKMERKQREIYTKEEYSHLNKQQRMVVRSARGRLTARPDSGFIHSWVHMTRRAMKESDYSGTIITFSHDVQRYYEDKILIYAMDYITRVRTLGNTPGAIYFASGSRITMECHDSPTSTLGVHVKELLVDIRTSTKKPLTEILRKS